MKVEPSRFSHLLSTLLHWGPSFQNMTFWGLRDTCLNHWKCVFMATPHKKTVKKMHSTLRNWGLQKLPCCPADSGQQGAQKLVWGPCFKYWSLLDTLWIHWTWGKKSSNFYLECEHKILVRLKEQRPLWPWSNWNQKCPNEPKGEVGQDWNEGIGGQRILLREWMASCSFNGQKDRPSELCGHWTFFRWSILFVTMKT